MTVRRMVRGVCIEAELTPEELRQAAEEYENSPEGARYPQSLYVIRGYDKDYDIFETICISCSYTQALEDLKDAAAAHAVSEMHCTQTAEPYDWFELQKITRLGSRPRHSLDDADYIRLAYTNGTEIIEENS